MLPEKNVLVELYRKMLLDRYLEEAMVELYRQGYIPGSLHLGIGHEALSIGTTVPLRRDDYLVFSHRGVGHSLGKGVPARTILAEFMGRATGCSLGKGGVHLSDFSVGCLGISGSQGGNIVIATGAGLSAKMRGTDQVTAVYFGEGTANRGCFHEGINQAAVWRLPVIFICENDLYSYSTHQSKIMLRENVADHAYGYGIPGVVVDGNDVLAVYEAMQEAIARARAGEGPTLIEGKTYRWRGHHEKDPALYRDPAEVEAWKQKCPIKRFELFLQAERIISPEEQASIQDEVRQEVQEAIDFALNSPFPQPEELYRGVYANPAGILDLI
ncbi:thiamine pyrophosphate-dependent dehydrogenase E1 component subunit alpha [Moorella sulfitireducens]|uniref:thiamine pyrophosphate-dependent dehydrogenase E1 component subunit alpha n=1 Tax=Neomoorella sulfitireducens TaxID=2972948 RepID=UPI0021AC0676|nr:thiamine pyrophosphate-dependent dehydrogenase E1 component subunit alpha [Moorella sulfitireducens]